MTCALSSLSKLTTNTLPVVGAQTKIRIFLAVPGSSQGLCVHARMFHILNLYQLDIPFLLTLSEKY